MDDLRLKRVPTARTGMLIRRPVADVFEAFINPAITTNFWFTRSNGRLENGKQLQWDWEMYGISIPVTVKAVEPMKRIVVEWTGHRAPTTVEWTFAPLEDGMTFVSITNTGFQGDGDEVVSRPSTRSRGLHWSSPA